MIISINSKNKGFKKKLNNNLECDKELKLNMVDNSKYLSKSYEDIFDLQLLESCISIDDDCNQLEYINDYSQRDSYLLFKYN